MDKAMLEWRLQNAFAQSTYDLSLPVIEILSSKEIADDLWHITFTTIGARLVTVLAYVNNQGDMDLFFTLPSVRALLLDPMVKDVKNAIKDYHSIGHGG